MKDSSKIGGDEEFERRNKKIIDLMNKNNLPIEIVDKIFYEHNALKHPVVYMLKKQIVFLHFTQLNTYLQEKPPYDSLEIKNFWIYGEGLMDSEYPDWDNRW